MLEFDFLMMDTKKSRLMAEVIMKYLRHSSRIHVTTPAGTDLQEWGKGQKSGVFQRCGQRRQRIFLGQYRGLCTD